MVLSTSLKRRVRWPTRGPGQRGDLIAGRLDCVAKDEIDRPLGHTKVFAPQHRGVRLVPLRARKHHLPDDGGNVLCGHLA